MIKDPKDPKERLSRLARAARAGVLSVDCAARALELPPRDASAVLSTLTRSGWLRRLRRGLYTVLPLEVGRKGSELVEDPWVLADELFAPCYIAGWSAAEYWKLTEQIFRSTFVASATRIRRSRQQILAVEFYVVQIPRSRMNGVRPVWRGPERTLVSSPERTLADALVNPAWVGGVRHLSELLLAWSHTRASSPAGLLAELDSVGTGAAYQRLGYLAEELLPHAEKLIEIAFARRATGVVKLDPSVAHRGRILKRWRLRVNVAINMSTNG